ncbi:MAG: TIGR04283 family arsenosugar biosynthesis glycosyltransferase [Desulfarculaceae bacterium]|nr:TIGR04283 family arsenosugar biosynthesis glycosyltransferase [Desulfarculaceae bacterium]MCF8071909.1 TIGR04283 family arsenosugar biosynthesis glycosyltransferase [Desulfarculaceae bacterium]MCF8103709.1 TIGR04283 family arsenosugar biosynthesis glycosyltransferase [Desulfarculaceae bacterium]MCF8114976.1 TIGR04283 family arsenosugar biosynthesis glycosyltransferase [Desulfarculaceae bacterium]
MDKSTASRTQGNGLPAAAISVIIPALNEEKTIAATVASALGASGAEVLVVDGGSRDATMQQAEAAGAKVMRASRGRASQMNAGAARARGDVLLFLHADTRLPLGWQREVARILALPNVAAGAFAFRLDHRPAGLRFIELSVAARCRWAGLPYGDQGLFLTHRVFQRAGGFPNLPIMEDCEMIRRLRALGRVALSPAPAVTSARRWQRRGALATTGLNFLVVGAFYLGFSPAFLRRFYDRL